MDFLQKSHMQIFLTLDFGIRFNMLILKSKPSREEYISIICTIGMEEVEIAYYPQLDFV